MAEHNANTLLTANSNTLQALTAMAINHAIYGYSEMMSESVDDVFLFADPNMLGYSANLSLISTTPSNLCSTMLSSSFWTTRQISNR